MLRIYELSMDIIPVLKQAFYGIALQNYNLFFKQCYKTQKNICILNFIHIYTAKFTFIHQITPFFTSK